jgi:hypothetical protein
VNVKPFIPVALLALLLTGTSSAQPTQLSIEQSSGSVRLGIAGEPGRDYTLEAASDNLGSNGWQLLFTATLPNAPFGWFDAASSGMPKRFYRALKLTDPTPRAVAADFRLIDHLGKSHELDYHISDPNVNSIVLIFTGNGCAKVHEMTPAIKSLRDQFGSSGVLFWMIDANPSDNRSNIVVEANTHGIDLPILHDPAQVVAREYGATSALESVALRKAAETGTTNWVVFYRGALDDRLGPAPGTSTQYYLSNALTALLSGQPVTISRTQPDGCPITLNPPQAISYSADIAPLLQEKCVRCHSPGNIAPWAMTDYNMVRSYAPLIKQKVLAGEMPPWHADPFYGSFTNDCSLTPRQAAMLVQWINDSAPRGTGLDPLEGAPVATNYPFAWPVELGQPDGVASVPVQDIPASGDVDYRYLTVTSPFATDVWLRAAVVRPGNVKVVHHSLVFNGTTSQFMGLDGFFSGYVPGTEPTAFPSGSGRLLRRGEQLTFQMHYITSGQPETDQTQLGFYVMASPPAHGLQTKSTFNTSFVLGATAIPAGANDFEISAQYPIPLLGGSTLTTNILLYEMSPHMHLRGSRFRYEVVYPDNTREVLLSVPRYIFHWQRLYRLAQPKYIPKGSQIVGIGAWDNSPQNPDNPDPSATVYWGDQTYDEMFIGYFNFAEVP